MGRLLRQGILVLMMLMLCCGLSACGASSSSDSCNETEDIPCVIGVISDGDAYTAWIDLEDGNWTELTEQQKENVVDQCVETAALTREDDDTAYELTGMDKETKEKLFVYSGDDHTITFAEDIN